MVRLIWTEISTTDLKEIYDYIAENSKKYASITINKIYSKAQKIPDNPYLGRIVPEININTIREIIIGNYRLIYKVKNDEQIDILRIYHSARILKQENL